jgi:hypothetical protein
MRKLAKKLVGGSSKPLKKAQVGITTPPPMSPRMNAAVSDSTAGAQKMAQLKSNYDKYELKNSNLKNQMVAAESAINKPGRVRRSEKENAMQAARSASNEASIKANYQKNWAGRYPSSTKSSGIAVKKSGGALKKAQFGATVKAQSGGTAKSTGYKVPVKGTFVPATDSSRKAFMDKYKNSELFKDAASKFRKSTQDTSKVIKKTGGSTSAFAKLAPPYNKATFADKIVGAKKKK